MSAPEPEIRKRLLRDSGPWSILKPTRSCSRGLAKFMRKGNGFHSEGLKPTLMSPEHFDPSSELMGSLVLLNFLSKS